MRWTIEILRPVPSGNDRFVNGHDRASMARYRKLRNSWAVDLTNAAMSIGLRRLSWRNQSTDPGTKRMMVLTRIMGPRLRAYDFDDLVGGCKPIIDAMKPPKPARVTTFKTGPRKGKAKVLPAVHGAGLIIDDSPKWLTVEYRQERGPVTGCRIELEDAP